jgi:hypothetical protein
VRTQPFGDDHRSRALLHGVSHLSDCVINASPPPRILAAPLTHLTITHHISLHHQAFLQREQGKRLCFADTRSTGPQPTPQTLGCVTSSCSWFTSNQTENHTRSPPCSTSSAPTAGGACPLEKGNTLLAVRHQGPEAYLYLKTAPCPRIMQPLHTTAQSTASKTWDHGTGPCWKRQAAPSLALERPFSCNGQPPAFH